MPIMRTGLGLQVYRRFESTVIDSLHISYDLRAALRYTEATHRLFSSRSGFLYHKQETRYSIKHTCDYLFERPVMFPQLVRIRSQFALGW